MTVAPIRPYKALFTGVFVCKSLHNSSGDNIFHSPTFANYILDNWCGLIPLWTPLHVGDQGRHGTSYVYKMWSDRFGKLDCVTNPPKTQGLIGFHQKSVKHITLNSKRERLDSVIKNLCVAKKSKLRQFEISKSRKKSATCKGGIMNQVKDTVPSKIACEKWNKRKRKQSGKGYFQKNKVPKLTKKSLEEWEKLQIIAWGGNYVLSTGQEIRLHQTCAIDTFFGNNVSFLLINPILLGLHLPPYSVGEGIFPPPGNSVLPQTVVLWTDITKLTLELLFLTLISTMTSLFLLI